MSRPVGVKIRVPIMVQDPAITAAKGMDPIERVELTDDLSLDGPISRHVAVFNFDPATGELEPGAKFQPPEGGKVLGGYDALELIDDPSGSAVGEPAPASPGRR